MSQDHGAENAAPQTPTAPRPRARLEGPLRMLRTAGRSAAAVVAAGFACLSYSYLTLPDVRPLRTSNPQTTAFIELRAAEARAHGKTPRRLQRWLSYRSISPDLKR